MGISAYGLVIFLLIVIFTVSGFGSLSGYVVDGVPQAGGLAETAPGVLGIIEWVWDSLTFIFHMITFQVDGMPLFINTIFLIISLLTAFLIIRLVRGVS